MFSILKQNSHYATLDEMAYFHSKEYLQFIEMSSFSNKDDHLYTDDQIQNVIND